MVLKDLLYLIDSHDVTIRYKELSITIIGYLTEEKIQSIPDEIVNRNVDCITVDGKGIVFITIR